MLLKGFLKDEDVNTIILDKTNVDLLYESPQVEGDEDYKTLKFKYKNVVKGKTMHTETIPEFELSDNPFFKLSGNNHENYEIDRSENNEPKIIGRILRRPINVQFYNVMKVYDGNPYINRERLAYNFLPTDDSSSGLVYGTNKEFHSNYITSIECISPGKGYSTSDSLEMSCEFNQSEGVNINALNTDGTYEDIRNYSSNSIGIEIESVSDKGEIQSVKLKPNNEGFNIINPIPYDYDSNTREFELNLYHTTENYINYKGKNKKEYGYNKIKELYPLKIKNTQGAGVEFKLTLTAKKLDNNTHNTEVTSYVVSDFDCLSYGESLNQNYIKFDPTIQFESKNVTDELRPLTFISPKLSAGPLGDVSNCYVLNKVSGYGIILPRLISFTFEVIPKTYDGNSEVKVENILYYNVVTNDDVTIDIDKTKFFLSSSKAGAHVIINPNESEIYLTGKDSGNYIVQYDDTNIDNCIGIINKKDVTVYINYIRFIVYTGRFEISYNVEGVISKDDVYIDLQRSKIEILKSETSYEVSGVFIDATSYDISKFTYTQIKGTDEIPYIEVKADSGKSVEIYNNIKVNINNFNISGNDVNNYNLTTNEVTDIPLYIIYSR